MKKISPAVFFIFFLLLFHSYFALAGDSYKIQMSDPVTFVPPLPTIPSTIPIGNPLQVTYTVSNNISTAYVPIYTEFLNADSVPVTGVITRTNIGASGDCGPEGTLLKPLGQCTISLSINPSSVGAGNYIFVVNYHGRYNLTTPISFNAIPGTNYVYVTNGSDNTIKVCPQDDAGHLGNCIDSGVGDIFSSPAGIAFQMIPLSTGNSYVYTVNKTGNSVEKCQTDVTTGLFIPSSCGAVLTGLSTPIGLAFQSMDSILYSYTVNSAAKGIEQCTVSSGNGNFSSCSNNLGFNFNDAQGITFQTVNSIEYAYVVKPSAGSGSIIQCTVDNSSGALSVCLDSGVGNIFDTPENITFYTTDALYAYVTDSEGDSVWQCSVNSTTGNLSACTETTGFTGPVGIAFATINSLNYSYVTNVTEDEVTRCEVSSSGELSTCLRTTVGILISDAAGIGSLQASGIHYIYPIDAAGQVFQCRENPTTGQLYCVDAGLGNTFISPQDLSFQAINSNIYAYVTEPDNQEILQCSVNSSTGKWTSCTNAGPLGFYSPFDTAFGTVNSILYAYVSDIAYNSIFQCIVDVDGTLTGREGALCQCKSADLDISPVYVDPTGISLQVFSGSTFLYVVDQTNNAAYRCTLDSAGLFTACTNLGAAGLNSPQNITFQTIAGNTYAYIANGGATSMTVCSVSSAGTFNSCSSTTLIGTPDDITFDTVSGTLYAYITLNTGYVEQCSVNSANGALINCTSSFGNPVSVAFKTITGPETVVYVMQKGGNGLELCDVDSSGLVAGCTDSGAQFYFSSPFVPTDMAFSPAVGSGPFIYVTNSSDTGSVSVCQWNASTGAVSSCSDSGAGFSFGVPTGIAFEALGGALYAYITDELNNRVVQCLVNQSNGTLSACASTGSLFDEPAAIAFSGDLAYITDTGLQRVMVCKQTTGGIITECLDSGVGNIFSNPTAIAFAFTEIGGVPTAYVTDATAMSVQKCATDISTGLFTSCEDSEAYELSTPTGIAFAVANGETYGYFTNSGNNTVTQCLFNTAIGEFSLCAETGTGTEFPGAAGLVFSNPGAPILLNK